MQTTQQTPSRKAPPQAGRSRKTNGVQRKNAPLASGGTGSGSVTINYGASTSVSDGDFQVSLTISPQLVGDNDWMGLFASQSDLQSCINDINSGGDGSNYLTWEYVTDFEQSSYGKLSWDTDYGVTDGAVLGYFTKDYVSGYYRFVFQTSAYQA
jgi:hypothetical protein